MSKAPKKEVAIEELLEKERRKNRRIVTAVLIAVALLTGFIAGQVTMRNEVSDINAQAISTYISKTKQ